MSRFWELMTDEFGAGYAKSLALDITLADLDGRSPQEALDAGINPRLVWEAICRLQGVPEERLFGKHKPPKR